jgi:hypothetical protein
LFGSDQYNIQPKKKKNFTFLIFGEVFKLRSVHHKSVVGWYIGTSSSIKHPVIVSTVSRFIYVMNDEYACAPNERQVVWRLLIQSAS